MQVYSLQHSCEQLMRMISQGKSHCQIQSLFDKINQDFHHLRNSYELLEIEIEDREDETQGLKKKVKKLIGKIERREEQCQLLRRQMARNKDIHEHKISKMTKQLEKRLEHATYEPKSQVPSIKPKTSKIADTQCQILNVSLIRKLQQQKLLLLKRINCLEKGLQEQKNENHSKQLYIDSLLNLAMKSSDEDEENQSEDQNPEEEGQGEIQRLQMGFEKNEDSTLDANSDKGSQGIADSASQLNNQCEQGEVKRGSLILYWYQSIKAVMIKPFRYVLPS